MINILHADPDVRKRYVSIPSKEKQVWSVIMDFAKELSGEFSKQRTVAIAQAIGADQALFDEFMALFLGNDYRITQRSAWVVSHCIDNHPWLMNKHLESMVLNLQRVDLSDAVKRNTVRVMQLADLPESLAGITADICFRYLRDHQEPIAVKAYAMTIIYNLSMKYPELGDELALTIEDMMPYGSPGIRNRGAKILKALKLKKPIR